MSLSKADERLAKMYLSLGGRTDLSEKVLDELRLTLRWVLAITSDERPLDNRRILGPVIRLRLPFVNALSLIQVLALRRLRERGESFTPEERDRLTYLILCTVSGVSAGLQNTG